MSGKRKKLPVAYSVRTIVHCILTDNPKACRYTTAHKRSAYRACRARLEALPRLLQTLQLRRLHAHASEKARFFARIGVLPPELVIVDERFKHLCMLPYWTIHADQHGRAYRSYGMCPGYGRLPGCPPDSVPVGTVQSLVDQSDFFVVLQTRLHNDRPSDTWRFDVLHGLSRDIEHVLGRGSVVAKFGAGPCNACAARHCLYGQPCKTPRLQTVSLESAGICVDRLCSDLALLTNNPAWRLTWLKHFGFPQQTPRKWKYVEALAVRLPRPASP